MDSLVTSSLEKFRAQYPEGCLSADLVSVCDGQYIVRAAISYRGALLATGLAASADVQVAEDRARERAIALLGFGSPAQSEVPSNTQSNIQPDTSSDAPSNTQSNIQSNIQSDTSPDISLATQNDSPSKNVSPSATHAGLFEEADVTLEPPEAEPDPTDDSGPPLDAIAEEPQQPSAATIALENFSTSPNPVNLSDVIAQTDVELMRLGWTNAQGREYLEKTYGKRSRQHLTDEELMSFLLYLEDQ